jgi:hypothetical protein
MRDLLGVGKTLLGFARYAAIKKDERLIKNEELKIKNGEVSKEK